MPHQVLIWAKSMSSAKTALLIDGNAMIHRAWHVFAAYGRSDGKATSAVYGFASIPAQAPAERSSGLFGGLLGYRGADVSP